MPVDVSGAKFFRISRYGITTSDTALPFGATADGHVTIPPEARGGITHCLIVASNEATSQADPSLKITVYGLLDDTVDTENDPNGRFTGSNWFALWQLNNGNAVTTTTRTPALTYALGTAEAILYAESLGHVSMYKKLCMRFTSMSTNLTASGGFVFEAP